MYHRVVVNLLDFIEKTHKGLIAGDPHVLTVHPLPSGARIDHRLELGTAGGLEEDVHEGPQVHRRGHPCADRVETRVRFGTGELVLCGAAEGEYRLRGSHGVPGAFS